MIKELVIFPAIIGIIITFSLSRVKKWGHIFEIAFISLLLVISTMEIILLKSATGLEKLGHGLFGFVSTACFTASFLTAVIIRFIRKKRLNKQVSQQRGLLK